MKWAKKLDIEIGLFVALHTYWRQLNQHPYIHLPVTRRSLCLKHGVWRSIFFKKKISESCWRQAVITLLWKSYPSLNLPPQATHISVITVSAAHFLRQHSSAAGKFTLPKRFEIPDKTSIFRQGKICLVSVITNNDHVTPTSSFKK